MRTKRCSKCGETKPFDEFHNERRAKDGKNCRCKGCQNAANAASVKKLAPEVRAERVRAMNAKRSVAKVEWARQKATDKEWVAARRERHSAWRAANPDKVAASFRKYYEANREAMLERAAVRRAQHGRGNHDPVKRQMGESRRRALLLDAFVEDVCRDALIARDEGRCGICEQPIMDELLEVDHIVPLSRGGTHEMANCQIAHRTCNRRKHARVDYTHAA